MDSYDLHFERMSNIDLHPLSLPMSRLSPAKSNSSIVEQFAHHHQHGKGDSAYSSFSGGSTAPDYPSPFFPDDLQPSSFNHYADKYVKSLYNPSQGLQSDTKTMDQLYRSVEAFSQQYKHSNNNLNHYNVESGFNNNKQLSKQELASQGAFITPNPPPIPTRMDSFIATKNFENTRTHQENQPQSSRQLLEKSNVKKDRRASQPPLYHPHHLPNNLLTLSQTNPEYFAVNRNGKAEEAKIGKNLSQSPPKSANQVEHLKLKQSQSTYAEVKNGRNVHESPRRRAHSTNDFIGADSHREYRSWSIGQNVINSSIQHKGQFYFVTGVCKTTPDSETRPHASSLCASESGSELETYKLKERCHSTMENLFRPLQPSQCVLPPDERGFVNVSKCNNVVNMCEDNLRLSLSSKSSRSLEALEEIEVARDIGRHTPSNPIFYCGPERTSPQQQTKEATNLSSEPPKLVREEQGKRVNRQSLGDVASERINKETTPLLYQLTGASRAGFKTEVKSNALDFYREQLKDVQSRVLRETSFKRRDLQLSWPKKFTPSQDSEASTETLTPSVTSEDTEKGSVKEEVAIRTQIIFEKERRKKMADQRMWLNRKWPESESEAPAAQGPGRVHGEENGTESSRTATASPTSSAPTTRQRHSLGEKPFDWTPKSQSGTMESKKKRMNRPHSAGRILDSSTSSIRYAQFFSNQSSSGQSSSQPYQPKWRDRSQGKSASVEDLLDQPENRSFYRNRSTSSPHPFQLWHRLYKSQLDSLCKVNNTHRARPHKDFTEACPVKAEGQQPIRVVAQRGKSMEELGTTTFTRPKAFSKSTEQLDQLWRHSTRLEPDRSSKIVSNTDVKEREEIRLSKSQELVQNQDWQKQSTQGQTKQKKSPVKQNSEPILGGKDDVLELKDSDSSPGSCSSARARIHSHGAVPNEPWTNPPECPSGQDPGEREMKSTSSSPSQTKPSYENRQSPRTRSSASVSEVEESVDEPSIADLPPPPPPDPNQEVSLSCGVTTEPSLWLFPPPPSEDQLKQDTPNPPATDVFTDEPPSSAPPAETTPSSVSPSTSVSDLDVSQHEEKAPQNEDENLGQTPNLEERRTPEGKTEDQETPAEKPQWEELVVSVVKADQSLARALFPLANRKTALMLMEQLLSEDTLLMEEHYKKKQEQKGERSLPLRLLREPCTGAPFYYKDKQKQDVKCSLRLALFHLLVSHIEDRLSSLADSRAALQTEIEENALRGEALQGLVRERCLPVELERYNLFMGDLERVVSLLLCLSARLARVQNALSTVDQHTDAEEKQSLDSRHRLLCKQRDDAKDLKDNLDRRESQVSAFLSRQLSPEQLQEYKRHVQTKASLLIRQKDLEERQRLGEEQLEALSHSLIH
ncbi:hypothetical protein WMY93_008618 [Mugilogobius chulae]|uniref:Shroom family member 1 n=1 Tax=Mugilogobius chulae TaxID=88201 RepID=A0AAW0PQG0_9GOBI